MYLPYQLVSQMSSINGMRPTISRRNPNRGTTERSHFPRRLACAAQSKATKVDLGRNRYRAFLIEWISRNMHQIWMISWSPRDLVLGAVFATWWCWGGGLGWWGLEWLWLRWRREIWIVEHLGRFSVCDQPRALKSRQSLSGFRISTAVWKYQTILSSMELWISCLQHLSLSESVVHSQ